VFGLAFASLMVGGGGQAFASANIVRLVINYKFGG
jgi:hypothetical protein